MIFVFVPLLSNNKSIEKELQALGGFQHFFAFCIFIYVLLKASVVNENKFKSREQKG